MKRAMIQENIWELTEYALHTGLIEPADIAYTVNCLLELFELEEPDTKVI